MNVTVLFGGPGDEREISLISGRAVIQGLREAGHRVFESDVSPTDLSGLDHPADVVFPVLHGQFGESGELQEILEKRRIPFVGSGSSAARLGMNKVDTKKAWEAAGLPTPPYKHATRNDFQTPLLESFCVVKAVSSGSSIDVHVCKKPTFRDDARAALKELLDRRGEALIESCIVGTELTVGLLEEKPLAPIRIVPKGEFFNFEAKYKSNETEHRFDTNLPDPLVQNIREMVRRANDVVGAKDLARIDVMVDEKHNAYLLEINTLPGFTPKSLLPEAANHAGINFPALVDRLVKRAAARGPR